MSELLTYGSVGGVGRKPGPYPALDAAKTLGFISNAIGAARVSSIIRQKFPRPIALERKALLT